MKEGDAKRTRKMEWKGREGKRAIKERQDGERGPVQDRSRAESCSGFESRGCRDVDERQSAWAAQ